MQETHIFSYYLTLKSITRFKEKPSVRRKKTVYDLAGLKSAELKQEVERGSTFTRTIGDPSCIASILFANEILRTYVLSYFVIIVALCNTCRTL